MSDYQHKLFDRVELTKAAVRNLREARDFLIAADCPMATNKVRRAIKSAEGALRNQSVRETRARLKSERRVSDAQAAEEIYGARVL